MWNAPNSPKWVQLTIEVYVLESTGSVPCLSKSGVWWNSGIFRQRLPMKSSPTPRLTCANSWLVGQYAQGFRAYLKSSGFNRQWGGGGYGGSGYSKGQEATNKDNRASANLLDLGYGACVSSSTYLIRGGFGVHAAQHTDSNCKHHPCTTRWIIFPMPYLDHIRVCTLQ